MCLQRQGLLVNLQSARSLKTRDQDKCVRVTCHVVAGLLNSVASSAIMDNPALPTVVVRLTFSLHVSTRKRTVLVQLFLHDILCTFKAEVQVRSQLVHERFMVNKVVVGQVFANLSGSFHPRSIFVHSPNKLHAADRPEKLTGPQLVKKFPAFFGTLYLPIGLFPSGLPNKS